MDMTPDILATIASFVGTTIVLFASLIASTRWLDRKITDTRVELKGDIQRVQQKLEGDIASTRSELKDTRAELKGDIQRVQQKLEGDIANVRVELKGDIANFHSELKGDIASTHSELKGDIVNVRSELKAARVELKGEIQLVRQNSEEAHREINDRLRALKDQVHVVDKGLSTLTARVDCIDDKIDSMQRQSEEA